MTLRTRIATATAIIVTTVVIALSLATYLTMSRQLIHQTDDIALFNFYSVFNHVSWGKRDSY